MGLWFDTTAVYFNVALNGCFGYFTSWPLRLREREKEDLEWKPQTRAIVSYGGVVKDIFCSE